MLDLSLAQHALLRERLRHAGRVLVLTGAQRQQLKRLGQMISKVKPELVREVVESTCGADRAPQKPRGWAQEPKDPLQPRHHLPAREPWHFPFCPNRQSAFPVSASPLGNSRRGRFAGASSVISRVVRDKYSRFDFLCSCGHEKPAAAFRANAVSHLGCVPPICLFQFPAAPSTNPFHRPSPLLGIPEQVSYQHGLPRPE
jgi:hypothetical protein